MREILFRGKTEQGEWVFGYYLVAAGMAFISAFGVSHPIIVDCETVGQYTGLKDKNGTKIFEGDVILFKDEKWVCVWSEDKWLFDSNKQKGQWMTWALNESEVIGNIHESEA